MHAQILLEPLRTARDRAEHMLCMMPRLARIASEGGLQIRHARATGEHPLAHILLEHLPRAHDVVLCLVAHEHEGEVLGCEAR